MADKTFYAGGLYVAEVTGQALSKTKNGNYQIVLSIKILGKPDPKSPTAYIEIEQKPRTIYIVITDKTIDYVIADLETLGFVGTSFGMIDSEHPQHQNLIGTQVDVWCKHDTGIDGNTYEKWRISHPPSGGLDVDPLDNKGVRQLDSLFGAQLKKIGKPKPVEIAKKTTTPTRADADKAMEITDDDIPF